MDELRKSIENQTDNSLSLAHSLLSETSNNVVFSPLSVHVLLGMIAAGSKGPTRDQIVGFLISSTSADELTAFFSQIVSKVLADGASSGGRLVLSTANGLWVDRSFTLKPAFRDLLHNVFGAVSQHADFQNKAMEVTEQVNKWCSQKTNGLIQNILPPDAVNPPFSRLILANALYFKAKWKKPFHPMFTEDHNFRLLDGSSVRAPLMSGSPRQYFQEFEGFKVLRLPYQQGSDTSGFSMYIYLPDAKDGLPALLERVCSQSGFIDKHLPHKEVPWLDKCLIPRFKITFDFEASGLLKRLGLVLPFEGGGGELTEMVEYSPLPVEVSGMFHKSFIEVNEEGTEAGAVSTAVLTGGGGPSPGKKRLEFVADHPFLFLIKEDSTGLVLFIGQLLNPLAERVAPVSVELGWPKSYVFT